MKCQILFSGKNKKNITNLSSAELAKREVKVSYTKKYQYFSFLSIKMYVVELVGITSKSHSSALVCMYQQHIFLLTNVKNIYLNSHFM